MINKYLSLLPFILLQTCLPQPYGELDFLGYFPSNLSEISGIEIADDDTIWAIEDHGNNDMLYKIDFKGNLIKKLKVENAKNNDWEDLTMADDGTLYIGDFGNNHNTRKDLIIYKIAKEQLGKKTPKAEKIRFYYPEQRAFPPKKDELLFDVEGFFHWNDHLYLFTKNRCRPYSGKTLAYKIPDKKGSYEAIYLGDFTLCKYQDHCSVTAADISRDGKTIALLGYGFLYLLHEFDLNDFSNLKTQTIDLKLNSQMESVCFLNEKTVLIADEESKTKGRNLYRYHLPD